MLQTEIIMCIVLLALGALTTKSDISEGMIYNKDLIVFVIIGIILDSVYYGFFVNDLLLEYILNMGIVVLVSIFLFYTHSFAGGDCKLAIVYALIYPARFYMIYRGSNLTLIFAIGIAIIYGYFYLLISAIWSLVCKKNSLTVKYIRNYVWGFVKSFALATIYISVITLCVIFATRKGISVNIWVTRVGCMVLAWFVGKYGIFRKWYTIGAAVVIDVVLSFALQIIPFSVNPENYILVIILLLCQMMIKTNLYEEVKLTELKKGMILSTFSSIMMRGSRVRGLPSVSSEDLRDRLTQDQVESIRRWGEGRNIETVSVVRKIPFAVFLSLGYISYLILWSVSS
jgi:preflagellin peptidase FlaK